MATWALLDAVGRGVHGLCPALVRADQSWAEERGELLSCELAEARSKAVERHVVGAISDGMERAESGKPASTRSFGHLIVEFRLVVAGDAGVGGIVRIWGVQGGGSGAERAVHEAFEHGGVEEGIGDWVGRLVFFQGGDREVEG